MPSALYPREAELMTVLWDHGPSTVAEVRKHLGDDRAYTTILTLLRTLEAKGYVRHTIDGKAHRYAAAVDRSVATRKVLRDLLKRVYSGSVERLLTHFLSDRELTQDEARRIRKLILERTRK